MLNRLSFCTRSPSFRNCLDEGFVLHSGMCITICHKQLLPIICSSVNRILLFGSAWGGSRLILKIVFKKDGECGLMVICFKEY